MANRIKVVTPTNEQVEYENAKKSFRMATAKARLNSVGIETSKISQQVVDKVMRIFDDMDYTQQERQQKISKLQNDAEIAIQKVNQDTNQKFGDIQKKYQDLINSLKEDKKEDIQTDINVEQTDINVEQTDINVEQTDINVDVRLVSQIEPIKEEVREKTHEEKVAEITDILLNNLRGSVSEKINEIMCIIDKQANETVVIEERAIMEKQTKEEIVN